ncbi:hypothetical protein P43SY_006154 [Pythium insidiosum]|uniref:Secreted RxLR effector peptide protein n=1 Tax=Pythium insidiosum TaxID=114742 RepID=A0AAD5M267_PYTIN|nr:hypothetical protein P43SY_006154 [Pythium insidiosum]
MLWLRVLAALCVVSLALASSSVADGDNDIDIDLSELNATSAWSPLSEQHLADFFQRPRFSLMGHVETFRARRRRRLEVAAVEARSRQQARRLSPSTCGETLKELKGDFEKHVKTEFSRMAEDARKNFNVKQAIRDLPNLGKRLRDFDFAALGHGLLDALDVGLFVKDLVTLEKDVQEMVSQAKAVIDKIKEAERIIRNVGNTILDRMELRDFDHFIKDAIASAKAVFDSDAKTKDQHFAVCRAFDFTTITKLSSSMQNYQLCTDGSNRTVLQNCQYTVGLAASSAMMQSLTAAAFCDAHFMIAQSHSSYPLSSLKQDAQNLLADEPNRRVW